MFNVLIGFLPWIFSWTLSGMKQYPLAILSALAASALIVAGRRIRKHNTKTLELVTLCYFLLHAILTLALGSNFLITYGAIANYAVLATVAFGTLAARNPFTYQYAKEDWDESYWDDPDFILINRIITGVWGGIFTINTLLASLAVFAFPQYTVLLATILPVAGIASGVVFSTRYPPYAARRAIHNMLDKAEPHKWPAPDFAQAAHSETAHDVIIIGAGIGGLTAAALLARRGLRVAVFEQHGQPGGFCTSWERRVKPPAQPAGSTPGTWRYVFDAGVHDFSGLGARGAIRSLLRMLDAENRIEWKRNTMEYRQGNMVYRVPHDPGKLAGELADLFPAEAPRIRDFLAEMQHIYREMYADIEKTGGVPRSPTTVEDYLAYPASHPHAYRWMTKPFPEILDAHFTDPELIAFFSALAGYLADDPAALTVGNMAPVFGYYFDGGFYPAGGSQKLADTLADIIREHDGRLFLRTHVQRILVENNCATAVLLKNGQIHRASAILSNADARQTFLELLDHDAIPPECTHQIEALAPSPSAFLVFLGLDIVPELASVTMLHDIAITVPSKVDPSLAPPGHAALTLIRLIPREEYPAWNRTAPDYASKKRNLAEAMIESAAAHIPDLRQHITYREEASPATFARFALTSNGCIYGPAAGQPRLPVKTPVRNLYIAGSATMGGGIEAVVISGVIAADAIRPPPSNDTGSVHAIRDTTFPAA